MTKANNQKIGEKVEHTCTPNSGGCSGNCMCYCHNNTGDWEEKFSLFMNQHDNFLHGLDRSQIPYLKQFISDLLQEQKQSILEEKKGETKRIWFQKGYRSAKQEIIQMGEEIFDSQELAHNHMPDINKESFPFVLEANCPACAVFKFKSDYQEKIKNDK